MWNFAMGFATGFGAGYYSRELAAFGRDSLRPAVKAVIRETVTAGIKLRESLAVAGESFEDLVAEIRAEVAAAQAAGAAGAPVTGAAATPVVQEAAGQAESPLAATSVSTATGPSPVEMQRAGGEG